MSSFRFFSESTGMLRLSMNELTTYRWSFDEDIRRYLAAGFDALSVWRPKLADFGEQRGIELLAQSGLHVAGLFWAGGFTGSDGRSHRECVDDAKDAVHLAARMNADCLVLYSGSRAGHTLNHAQRLLCEALTFLAPIAEEHGVKLALEPMHEKCAKNSTFLNCCLQAIDVLDQVDSPTVKLVFDSYYWGRIPMALDRIAEIAPHVALVQLGDSRSPPDAEQNRCRLHEGDVPLQELVSAFVANGYNGYFDVELLGEEIEHDDYESLLAHSKAVGRQLLELAAV
jgi:sugar phosphate isomerase/epimerase